MDAVNAFHIPDWHPLLVHFPIVLLLAGALFALGFAIRDRRFWLWATGACEVLGLAMGFVAYRTGDALWSSQEGALMVERFAETHEMWAGRTLWLAAATLAMLLVIDQISLRSSNTPGSPWWGRLGVLVLAALTAASVAWTGHVGAIMVWGIAV